MTDTVNCVVLNEPAEALGFQPYPGELGQKIVANVSKPGWQKWLAHQTMLINENRLTPIDPEHRAFLEQEMEKFFFGEGSQAPEGYRPVE